MSNERQPRTPTDPQREQHQKRAAPKHIIEPAQEQHSHKPVRVSQEEMQKIMPPDPDPDDPASP
jgi:hypothetical protein